MSNYAPRRRLLFLAYSSGLQIWDCSILASVSELLNLTGTMTIPDFSGAGVEIGRVTYAAVLPSPRVGPQNGASGRPFIGLV